MTVVEPRPSATVVLLRDVAGEIEVLLVRRHESLAFHGGAWVFPGGRIEPSDRERSGADGVEAARNAAVREAREETGLSLEPASLRPFAEWVTPEELPKRFRTWFFVARVSGAKVRIDGGEVVDHSWISPARALAARREGAMDLPPPTFVTLTHLASHATAQSAIAALTSRGIVPFYPRVHKNRDGGCMLYQGDVAYETGDLATLGARHRLYIVGNDWRYERNF